MGHNCLILERPCKGSGFLFHYQIFNEIFLTERPPFRLSMINRIQLSGLYTETESSSARSIYGNQEVVLLTSLKQ